MDDLKTIYKIDTKFAYFFHHFLEKLYSFINFHWFQFSLSTNSAAAKLAARGNYPTCALLACLVARSLVTFLAIVATIVAAIIVAAGTARFRSV